MKRHLMLIVGAIVVGGLAWVAFGQPEGSTGERGSRRGMWRERRQKAVAAIEEQLAKIKAGMESSVSRPANWRELSEEERAKFREQLSKARQEQMQSIAVIEEEIAKLKGRRSLTEEHEKSMSELKAIHDLAVKEKATETVAHIEKLVAAKNKVFEEKMKKLGLPERPARTRTRGGS
jgi:hypothetical protein